MKHMGLVVLGTDTDAGKTHVAGGVLHFLRTVCDAVPAKPVQTGCVPDAEGRLSAPDLDLSLSSNGLKPSDEERALMSPYLFRIPCSPHLAAEREGREIDTAVMVDALRRLAARHDCVVAESAGGALVPLNGRGETILDVIQAVDWPVLLVVRNGLGCINHAWLSVEALRSRGIEILGVVVNETKPFPKDELNALIWSDTAKSIDRFCGVPVLGTAPFCKGPWTSVAKDAPGLAAVLRAFARKEGAAGGAADGDFSGAAAAGGVSEDDIAFDAAHIWHPYTSMTEPVPCYPVVRAKGAEITLADGRTLVDGMSSWWAVAHGYRNPKIVQALHRQIDRFPHVMFGGITHAPAVGLARRLLKMLPPQLDKVFFSDSGSVAVEVALKMAFQYHRAQDARSPRTRVLTIRGGYHGDTFAAMSVCDPVNGMHSLFTGMLMPQLFADRPKCRFGAEWDPADFGSFRALMDAHERELAAVILEPIVQGAGGMWFYHPQYLREVRSICSERGIPLIFDEIATGFGRTGRLFAMEWAGVVPDICCVGKAMTGGVMTMAATLCTDSIARTISSRGLPFMHGPTFMGNAMACSAACASLDILATGEWKSRVAAIEAQLKAELAPCRESPKVADVRVLGAIGVVEMKEPVDLPSLQRKFVGMGVWIRPFGRLVYLMPPYVTRPDQLGRLTAAVRAVCG
jgi:adenosylmethionine-8-amino-7-oxononanoate aminotransferase